MTLEVTLRPSGHRFAVEYGETLLEAALRAGIALAYNCNNGRCGQCLAYLQQGELGDSIPSDFVFSQKQKSQNAFLLCRSKPATDLVIEVNELDNSDAIAEQTIHTRVYKTEQVAEDFIVLQLRTPRSQTLQFMAGQHVSLQIDDLPPRNKSIASCPCNGMYLQFHIHCRDNDPFSDYIFNRLKHGEAVTVTGPYGHFHFDDEADRPAVFIAYETGFAPIKSLIEHAIARERSQSLFLYWLVSDPARHYLENYCRAWSDVEDNFHYTPVTLSNQADDLNGELSAIIEKIANETGDITGCDYYLCTPDNIVQPIIQTLTQQGVVPARIHTDIMKQY